MLITASQDFVFYAVETMSTVLTEVSCARTANVNTVATAASKLPVDITIRVIGLVTAKSITSLLIGSSEYNL